MVDQWLLAGMLWQMYNATGDECYKKAAEGVEKKFDALLAEAIGLLMT